MLDLLTLILQRLATSIAAVNQQPSMASLRGLEGAGAAAYFEGFAALLPARLHFNGRNRRSPRDPANARLSLTSEQAFVIGYDISHPRRLLRVHREMYKHASLLEYSIFLLVDSDAAKDHCLQEIDALMNHRTTTCAAMRCRHAVFRAASDAPACPRESSGAACRRRSREGERRVRMKVLVEVLHVEWPLQGDCSMARRWHR